MVPILPSAAFYPHKAGNGRRVLNGAAKFHSSLLKNALLTGPDLLQNLINVLICFCQYKYAVSSDVGGLMLQVGVTDKNNRHLVFLCRKDPAEEIAVYQNERQFLGAKDSSTCASYAFNRTQPTANPGLTKPPVA